MMRFTWLMATSLVLASTTQAAGTREWNFTVSLDDRPIGEHRFTLRGEGEARDLTSEASFRVRLLFIEAYRYEHRAHERWRGNCLESLDARTDANGKPVTIAGQREPTGFLVQSANGRPAAAVLTQTCVQTFAYWNPSILDASHLLNPQTGEYQEIKVLLMGNETVGGKPASRYRLIGRGDTPLQIDLWYTPAGDWVALESLTAEGRRLHYARK